MTRPGNDLSPGDTFRALGRWVTILRVHQEGKMERTFICETEDGTKTYRSVLRTTNYSVRAFLNQTT